MKNYSNKQQLFFLITILSIFLMSCDEFSLTEEPKSFLTTDQYFISETDAEAALNSVYQCFFETYYYGLWWIGFPDMLSDYVNGRGGQGSISKYSLTTSSSYFVNTYSTFYVSINRANLVLKYVPGIEMDEGLKTQILAEARFIRALDYYNLVRGWGAVPLRIEPSEGLEGLSVPRSPENEVYKLILEDLKFAEDNLPNSYEADQLGRVTKWAAKTLLAEVYLTREEWALAALKAKEVIDSQQFSLVEVSSSDDFLQIWGADVLTSSEEIFAIHFTENAGTPIPTYMHNSKAGYSAGGYYAWMGEMKSWIKDWDINDLRRNFNMYNGDDTKWLSTSVPMLFKKYRDGNASGATNHSCDVLPLRYADVLLIFAEATSQANNEPNSDAYDAVNMIRRRAYGQDLHTPSPGVDVLQGLTAQQFRDAIIQERAYEFCIEGKRWWDLKRTGKARAAIEAVDKTFSDKYLLFPIPLTEIENNELISQSDQNPGWE